MLGLCASDNCAQGMSGLPVLSRGGPASQEPNTIRKKQLQEIGQTLTTISGLLNEEAKSRSVPQSGCFGIIRGGGGFNISRGGSPSFRAVPPQAFLTTERKSGTRDISGTSSSAIRNLRHLWGAQNEGAG